MDAALMSKVSSKMPAERPYCSEKEKKKKGKLCLFSGICCSPCNKENNKTSMTRYNAQLKKPDLKQEVTVFISIIKKGVRVLCRCSQDTESPDYEHIYFFVDMNKRLDKLQGKFEKIFCGSNSLCCYAKLLRDLKSIRCCFSKEIESNYCLYKCKMDLINCILATFRSIDNKICYIMAYSSGNECEEDCNDTKSNLKTNCKGKCSSADNSASSLWKESAQTLMNEGEKCCLKDVMKCCSDQTLGANRKSSPKVTFADKCMSALCCPKICASSECPPEKKREPQICDMILEYSKYEKGDGEDSESSCEEGEQTFRQELCNGYAESRISKKNNSIQLSLKCVSSGAETGLKQLAMNLCESDNSAKLAKDMMKVLNMSKLWYISARQLCEEVMQEPGS